jgi:hypothetical protein
VRVLSGSRLFLGAAVALSVALPVVAVATPASAAGCTASVSNPAPAQNTTVTVTIVGPANASATAVAHYRTVDTPEAVTLDANGHGAAGFSIGGAAYGETVVVAITAGTASCSTSFTPTAPASTTTTSSTTSTTAVLTGIASATTTTVAATRTTTTAAAAVTTGTVTAAAAAPSSLPFTGNATVLEATAGGLFVALGAFFLSSARRREELVRLLWPDER